MRRVLLVLLAVLALVAASCGSRADTDSAEGDGGTNREVDGGGDGDGDGQTEASPDSDKVGTVDNPCSDAAAEGEIPADAVGVTEDSIRIGVISDKQNPITPVPTIGIEESVKAFVEFCNEAGGINGRQLELKTYDSEIVKTDDVTKQACADDLFVLVGSGSVQDQQGVQTREECGLPEVAAYSATSTRAESENFFSPVPALSPTRFNVGPCQWIAEQFPDAIEKAAMVYTDLPAASVRGKQTIDACEAEAGFDYVVDFPLAFGEKNFGPLISQMKEKGVKYFSMVSSSSDTLAVMREIQEQGLELEVIDLGQQYYDPAIAEDPSADGAYVLTNTVPFSEADGNPALTLYQEYMEKVGGEQTTLGVQAFSAALLFATVTQALGSDLTREAFVEEIKTVTEWDGGGLSIEGNPGENVTIDCFMYLKVKGGAFVRETPEEGFECDPEFVYESDERFEN